MGDLVNHPRLPPPEPGQPQCIDEQTIRRRARAMREFFDGLAGSYPSSATGGRLDSWRVAAHAYIDLVTDAPEPAP